MTGTPAHEQNVTNRYTISYPAHEPRASDPHYKDFRAWKKRQRAEGRWRCGWAVLVDDDTDCDLSTPLEAHHSHIEFALANAVDLARLEHVYPGVSDPAQVGEWIEGDSNLVLLCAKHHRGAGTGVHHLSASDYEASHFVVNVFRDPAKSDREGGGL
jgi:hypothetical protein